MLENTPLVVGDKIIDYEKIHVISKIESDVVYFYPLVMTDEHRTLTSSIPLNNFKKAGIRPLMSKSEIKLFLKSLKNIEPIEFPANTNKNTNLKEFLYLNNPSKTGQLLQYLFERQNNVPPAPVYTKADKAIFDQALDHLADEISIVNDISIDKARTQILTAMKK